MLACTDKENINLQIPFLPIKSNAELNNQYTLKVVIESIFWIKDLQDNNITISFCNPIHQKFYTIPDNVNIQVNELTYLENIYCRMNLEIPSDQVLNIFAKWSPTIIICNKENTVLTYCTLNLKAFKFKKSKERTFVTKTLYDQTNEKEKVADINVILTVYDNKIKVSSSDNMSIGVPVFFKITEQLENWKQNQKQIFKRQEEERLNLLLNQWKEEKSKLQEKLLQNIQDTNNALQEIKTERDFLKKAVEIELNKRNKKKTDQNIHAKEKSSAAPINIKNKYEIKERQMAREYKEIQELRAIIKKQADDIKSLKEKCQSIAHFEHLQESTDKLKIQLYLKDQETEYLKQQWGKTIRQLNSKKHEKCTETEHTATHAMLPLMIQELLNLDAAEQKEDLNQLHSIRKELRDHKKEQDSNIFKENAEKSELNTLLETRTYSRGDKVIKMLNKK